MEWIYVTERLPEIGQKVLVTTDACHDVVVAIYQGCNYGFTCGLVIAWMPLPKPAVVN